MPPPASSTSRVSWLLAEMTRSNTCRVKKAGTRNSRLITKENAAIAPISGRSSFQRDFMASSFASRCVPDLLHGGRGWGVAAGGLQGLDAAAQLLDEHQLLRVHARELLCNVHQPMDRHGQVVLLRVDQVHARRDH